MAISRRDFIIKGGLAAAGTAATLGLGLSRDLFAQNSARTDVAQPTAENTQVLRYTDLEKSGELERREQALWELYGPCHICPRLCGSNRTAGDMGMCSAAGTFRVASHGPHHGEEAPLRGRRGSGTIFFSNCNLLCVFCLNWQTAHRGDGRETSHERLAEMMLDLQNRGCHNINLVTPSHVIPHIVKALRIAVAGGLTLPLLYNSSGYESMEVLKLLYGIVDIYLPDFKFQDSGIAARYTNGAANYAEHASAAIKEMHRQVGTLKVIGGIASRGLLIRHLVMPENLAGTDKFVRWVVDELGNDTHVNIMSQYTPMFRANEFPPLDRRLTQQEFSQAMTWAHAAGLRNFH